MSTMKRALLNFINGRPLLQPLFQKIHLLLLHAMGIGTGGESETSGELLALQYVKLKLVGVGSPTLFDVGANVGNYTKLLQKYFPTARIFSFEPSHETFETLRKNCPPPVHAVNLALSDRPAKSILYSHSGNSTIASLYQRKLSGKHSLDKTEEITVDTVDNFCAKNKVISIDLLKLDIEGNELKCLKGAERMLSEGNIRFVQFEFGGCNIDSRTFFRDFYNLLKDKYFIYRIMQHGLYEMNQYRETDELFTTTNYLVEQQKCNSKII